MEYFLNFLLERERLGLVGDIHRVQRIDAEIGRVHVEVTTAAIARQVTRTKPPSKAHTANEVVVDCKVDPEVMGGVVTRIGNTVLDTNIKPN